MQFAAWTSLLLLGSLATSCKKRTSDLKNFDAAANLLDISKLSPEEQKIICSQNILVVFLGDAQSIGAPPRSQKFNNADEQQIFTRWSAGEISLEASYFQLVKQSEKDLIAAAASTKQYCASPTMRDMLQKQKLPTGTVTIVSLIDGPNSELWQTDTALPDSTLTTIRIGFDPKGTWGQVEKRSWTIDKQKVIPAADNTLFEANTPEALDTLNAWISSDAGGINNGRPFTQTTYIAKGHGLRLAKSSYWGFLSSAPMDDAITDSYHPSPKSVFLIDPVPNAGAQSPATGSTFYSLIWNPKTYCQNMCQYLGSTFQNRYDGCEKTCFESVKMDSEKSYATLQAESRVARQNTQGTRDDAQGERNDTQGTRNDAQGTRTDTQGERNDTQGTRTDTQGERNDTQGVRNDTQGVRNDTQGERNDTQGSGSLTFGSGLWNSETQGQKSSLQYGSLGTVGSIFDGHPSSYRLVGQAKSLQSNIGSSPQSDFAVLAAAEQRSLVVLDTCSVALWSNDHIEANNNQLTIMPFQNSKEAPKQQDVIVLANPMPLLKNAIDYHSLDAFQRVLLAKKIFPPNSEPSDAQVSQQLLKSLLGPRTAQLTEKEVFRRLYAAKLSCQDQGHSSKKICSMAAGDIAVYLREQFALAARNLQSRLTNYRGVRFEFNLAPTLGAGHNFRELLAALIKAKLFDPGDAVFWEILSSFAIEDDLIYGFADPDKYQHYQPHSDGFSASFTIGSRSWTSADVRAHTAYRKQLGLVLASVYDQSIRADAKDNTETTITLAATLQKNLLLTQLVATITNYIGYFNADMVLADPWQSALKSRLKGTITLLASPKLNGLPNLKDLEPRLTSTYKRAQELHNISGIIKRTPQDLAAFNKQLSQLRTSLLQAVQP